MTFAELKKLKNRLNTFNREVRIDELEKLKAKMLEAQKPYDFLLDEEYYGIIDKRISELKGE